MKKLLSLLCLCITFLLTLCACNNNPPHTHTSVHNDAKNPTCSETGNVEYWSCSDCGKYFSDEALSTEITDKATVSIPATAHKDTVSHHSAKSAGCYTEGNIEYWECTECRKFFSDKLLNTEIIDKTAVTLAATAHKDTVFHHEAASPNCYNNGNSEYWECSLCAKCFSDEALNTEITDKATVSIPATAHKDTVSHHSAKSAGCYTEGNIEYWECTECGKFFSDNLLNTEIIDKTAVTLAATAHKDTVFHHEATSANCYNNGNSEYWECSLCGNYFYDALCTDIVTNKASVTIIAKAHKNTIVHHEHTPATCTATGTKEYWECTACADYFNDESCSVKISDKQSVILNIEPHEGNLTYYEGKDATCGKYGYHEYWGCSHCGFFFSDAAGINKLAYAGAQTIQPTGEHQYGDDYTCDVCNYVYSPYIKISNFTIEFGEYPQYMVDPSYDKALYDKLSAMVTKPTDSDSNGWTSYGYYSYGKEQNYMWYIDVTTSNGKYRGVYFTKYRPFNNDQAASTTPSNTNIPHYYGFNIGELYWFEYTTLSWSILEQKDGKALLMCKTIIDSQNYAVYKTGYTNNYAESAIRSWLNDTFYNTAFNELQQRLILNTNVDNSASTTASSTNRYVCPNTSDYIFLPSYQDMLNANYGFNTSASVADSARKFKASNYACAMGLQLSSYNNGTMFGEGSFLLRSPSSTSSNSACSISWLGDVRENGTGIIGTYCGVVPMLWIQL